MRGSKSDFRFWLPVGLGIALQGISFPAADAGLRQHIERVIAESGAEAAVAYRTLDGEDEIMIRADDPFHAASTMKIPVMIELFRQDRQGLLRLGDSLTVVNQFRSIVDGSPYQLEIDDDSDTEIYSAIGRKRTLRQLCEAMIVVSSNLATNLLIEKLGVENIRRTVSELGADGMKVLRGVEDGKAYRIGRNNTTTARALLILLEKLGRLEVVDPEASREMIEILKKQRFNEGIPSGLPASTPVAHKTGQITRIHHDAALVFAKRTYVLVILVRGLEDERRSARLMGDVAEIVNSEQR